MMDGDERFAIASMIIICMTIICVTGMLMSCDTAATEDVATVSHTVEHANGCPLDAIAYDAPVFTDGVGDSYKVTDRFSKQEWWLVRMYGSWVVLPIEEAR